MADTVGMSFKHTQGAYWGGPSLSYWVLILTTVLGGFLGLDHFLLRSPLTGLAKLIVNISCYGLWWIYDMLQILGDKDNVMKYGLTLPALGAAGIGSGIFLDSNPGATPSRSPLRYLGWVLLTFIPFGFDAYVAGDSNAAIAKFVSCITVILLPLWLIWTVIQLFKMYFDPTDVFEKGFARPFPFNWFMEPYGRSVLGPKDVPDGGACPPGGLAGVVAPFTAPVATAVDTVVSGAAGAVSGVTGAVEAAGKGISAVAEAATAPLKIAAKVAGAMASTGLGAAGAVPGMISNVGSKLETFQNPEALKKLAAKQMGGGSAVSGASDALSMGALLGFFVLVLGGGAVLGSRRLNNPFSFFQKNGNYTGSQRDDRPPQP